MPMVYDPFRLLHGALDKHILPRTVLGIPRALWEFPMNSAEKGAWPLIELQSTSHSGLLEMGRRVHLG